MSARVLFFAPVPLGLVGLVVLVGCSSTDGKTGTGNGQIGGQASAICAGTAKCEIGDGTLASVTLTEIYPAATAVDTAAEAAGVAASFVDLAFNAQDPTQLWVVGYGDDGVYLGSGVTATENGSWKKYHDPAALHFMHKPTTIAWGEGGLFSICSDTDNAQNDPRGANEANYFMGPALFTSDLAIFAKKTPGNLGSHVDMLHNTSMCRGVAHVAANVFWAFNGELGSLEMYNFNTPHEPGGDDHSDGEIYRFAAGEVKGVAGVPSHLFYDATDKFLYVADTGNGRIVRLDTTQGTLGQSLPRRNEVLKANGVMEGTHVEAIVPPGTLEQPTGLEVHDGRIYVTDAATSTFHVFDKAGKLLRSLPTGLPAGALAGLTFGPDGKVWFVDRSRGRVLRIDPN